MFANLKRTARSWWAPAVMAGGLALLDAVALEPELLKLTRIRVAVGGRAEQMAGLKIAQLSDLHVCGVGWRQSTVARAVEACNQEDVDFIAITGDFLGRGHGVTPALELLSTLRTDLPRIAVLGNHDHVYGGRPLAELLEGLRGLGITVLRNEATPVEVPQGRVWFVGVDDGYSMRDDLQQSLRCLRDQDSPRILLTHYPDVADRARHGEVDLSLAGHTHAGQVRLPVLTTMVNNGHARTSYGYGLYVVNGNPLYVTSGVGMSGIPLRFRNLPEVAILELTAVSSQQRTLAQQKAAIGDQLSMSLESPPRPHRNGHVQVPDPRILTTES